MTEWSGRRAQAALEKVRARGRRLGLPCTLCHEPINYDLPSRDPRGCSVQHVKSRNLYPHLTWDPHNWLPAHLVCNQRAGDGQTFDLGVTSN